MCFTIINPHTSVIGALIGKQKGRNIEIMNSFELVFSVFENDVIIDKDYYNMKEEQCKYHHYTFLCLVKLNIYCS